MRRYALRPIRAIILEARATRDLQPPFITVIFTSFVRSLLALYKPHNTHQENDHRLVAQTRELAEPMNTTYSAPIKFVRRLITRLKFSTILIFTRGNTMPANTITPDTHVSYCVYGYSKALTLKPRLTGFNGAHFDPHAHYYHLGQGYRAFSPTLMRFISPDRISPFGRGGINSYAYCNSDPVNRTDPSGAVAFARLRPLNWAYKIFFKKPNINVNFNKQNVQLPGQSPEETARLRLIAMKNGLRVMEGLLDKKPDLVEKVGQYLAPGDLTAAAAASDPFKTGVTPRIVKRITTERYLEQAENIMDGKATDYRNDSLLTKADISNLDRIEAEVRKIQNPSYFGDASYSPQEQHRKLMEHLSFVRSSLQHREPWS